MAETLTAGQICRNYRITRAGFQDWREDPTFPRPVEWTPELRRRYDHRTRHVWDAGQIAEWRHRKNYARRHRRKNALEAYRRHAGQHGHLTAVADAYEVDVGTLRAWVRAAGLPLPHDRAA